MGPAKFKQLLELCESRMPSASRGESGRVLSKGYTVVFRGTEFFQRMQVLVENN